MTKDKIDPKRFLEVLRCAAKPPPSLKAAKPELPKELKKYYSMLKVHVPEQSVINKMRQDKIDPSRLEEIKTYIANLKAFESGAPPPGAPGPPPAAAKPTLDPALMKYVKMKKMGVPEASIKHKMALVT